MSFCSILNQIKAMTWEQMTDVDYLRDAYRDLFIKQESLFHRLFDETVLDAIDLESFEQARREFQSFSHISVATNHPAMNNFFRDTFQFPRSPHDN